MWTTMLQLTESQQLIAQSPNHWSVSCGRMMNFDPLLVARLGWLFFETIMPSSIRWTGTRQRLGNRGLNWHCMRFGRRSGQQQANCMRRWPMYEKMWVAHEKYLDPTKSDDQNVACFLSQNIKEFKRRRILKRSSKL